MAMIIAWQTINSLRYPTSNRFTPRLPGGDAWHYHPRPVTCFSQPNDPDSYYLSRELVPNYLLPELGKAKIVITNYHAFKLRERIPLSKGGRSLLQGREKS